jgi:hypothetical protein
VKSYYGVFNEEFIVKLRPITLLICTFIVDVATPGGALQAFIVENFKLGQTDILLIN